MDDSIFRFRHQPFTAAPSAKNYWPYESADQAVEALEGSIARNTGPGMLIGPTGIGKSMICSVLAARLKERFVIATLASNRLCTRRALLQNILFELGLPFRNMEEGELRLTLIDAMTPSDRCPNGMALLVDEAHTLPRRLIEEIRMLTNLVRQGESRVRVVLIGSQLLEERFASPEHESFNQRIAVRYYLQPMTRDETGGYVTGLLNRAMVTPREIFDESALRSVYDATDGIPRLVNQVCDHALVLAEAAGIDSIDGRVVEEAWSDLQQLPTPWHVEHNRVDSGESGERNSLVIEFGSLGSEESSPIQEDDSIEEATEEIFDSSEIAADEQIELISDAIDAVVDDENASEPMPLTSEFDVLDDDALSVLQEIKIPEPPNPFEEDFDDEEMLVDPFEQILDHSSIDEQQNSPAASSQPASSQTTDNEPSPEATSTSNEDVETMPGDEQHGNGSESFDEHMDVSLIDTESGHESFLPSDELADTSDATDRVSEPVSESDVDEDFGADDNFEAQNEFETGPVDSFAADLDDYRNDYIDADMPLDTVSIDDHAMGNEMENQPSDSEVTDEPPLNLVAPPPATEDQDHLPLTPPVDPADDPVMPEFRSTEPETVGLNDEEREFLSTGDIYAHDATDDQQHDDDRDMIIVQPKTEGADNGTDIRVVNPTANPAPPSEHSENGRAVRKEYQDLFSKLRG